MKKTLVALAVLAASGASFAQVTISGSVIMGYAAYTNQMIYAGTVVGNSTSKNTVQDASGLGIDTSVINFTAKEDLGGGLNVTAIMGLDGVSRAGVSGGDSSLAIAGGFGTLKLATAKGSDYLSAGTSGVGGVGMDNKLFSALTYSDSIAYTSPSFSGVTVTVAHAEISLTQVDGARLSQVGIGQGAAGSNGSMGKSDYQRRNSYGVAYAAGPLSANAAYRTYDQYGDGNVATTTGDYTNSLIGAVSYDMGVAKLGFGFDQRSYAVGGSRVDMLAAVKVPFGAMSVGGNFGSRVVSGKSAASDGTQIGYSLVGAYDLSKRTNVSLNYASWDGANAASTNNWGARSTYASLLLAHSF